MFTSALHASLKKNPEYWGGDAEEVASA